MAVVSAAADASRQTGLRPFWLGAREVLTAELSAVRWSIIVAVLPELVSVGA